MPGVKGAGGPIPKRSSQRRRRNKDSKLEVAKARGPVKRPPADGKWHPSAKRWYASLAESGQSQFFEPSDWEQARFLAGEISAYLGAKQRSAMMFSHIWSGMNDLLSTEGARRRLKLEIEREKPKGDAGDSEIVKLDAYRRRATG